MADHSDIRFQAGQAVGQAQVSIPSLIQKIFLTNNINGYYAYKCALGFDY